MRDVIKKRTPRTGPRGIKIASRGPKIAPRWVRDHPRWPRLASRPPHQRMAQATSALPGFAFLENEISTFRHLGVGVGLRLLDLHLTGLRRIQFLKKIYQTFSFEICFQKIGRSDDSAQGEKWCENSFNTKAAFIKHTGKFYEWGWGSPSIY